MAGDVFALADKNRERRDYPRDAECVCVCGSGARTSSLCEQESQLAKEIIINCIEVNSCN